MSRSLKKGPYVDEKLMKKVHRAIAEKSRAPIKTWARDSTITPEMVGMRFGVHNGKFFIEVYVEENMVGHKLGEFSPTRRFIKHGGKLQKAVEGAAGAGAATPFAAPAGAAGGAAGAGAAKK